MPHPIQEEKHLQKQPKLDTKRKTSPVKGQNLSAVPNVLSLLFFNQELKFQLSHLYWTLMQIFIRLPKLKI